MTINGPAPMLLGFFMNAAIDQQCEIYIKENGLEENTIVLFCSDNGPWIAYGNHGGSTGGLKVFVCHLPINHRSSIVVL